ncbi:MAG: hypothetical protein LUG61_00435 [Lachnospiraceae bacterium]|nr:hypothetical protein [Lachnospiraceae bacterium]
MSVWDWIMIIAKIMLLIGEGKKKPEAVSIVADLFDISESTIWEHGGF